MTLEKWKYWKPSKKITSEYMITKLIHEKTELSVILEKNDNTGNFVKINFYGTVELYRVCDERSMQKRVQMVKKMNGKDFFTKQGFFIIENSNLVKWLIKESGGFMECFELKHFVFLNYDFFFDVITHSDPDITEVK